MCCISERFHEFSCKKTFRTCVQKELPLISSGPEFPEAGGLISYGLPIFPKVLGGPRFIDRFLKGTSRKDLPAQEPTKF